MNSSFEKSSNWWFIILSFYVFIMYLFFFVADICEARWGHVFFPGQIYPHQ